MHYTLCEIHEDSWMEHITVLEELSVIESLITIESLI